MREDDEVPDVRPTKPPTVAMGSGTVTLPTALGPLAGRDDADLGEALRAADTRRALGRAAQVPARAPLAASRRAAAHAALASRASKVGARSRTPAGLVDACRQYVFATTVLAIAKAWDTGRLAYPQAGGQPFETEVFGLGGGCAGRAAQHLHDAKLAHQQASAVLQDELDARDDRSPLHALCVEHGVAPIGEALLLFTLAPLLWGELARLYGILTNDPGRAIVDELLLCHLFDGQLDRREIARQLDRGSPLLRHGLVRATQEKRPFQAIVADSVLVKVFTGEPIDDEPEPGIEPVPPTVALEQFVAPPGLVDRVLTDLASAPPARARIVVRGQRGSGRRTLLAALAQFAGRTLATINITRLVREGRIGSLTEILQHVHLRGWLPCLDGLDRVSAEDMALLSIIRERIAMHRGPLAVRLPRYVAPSLEPGYVLVDLPTSTISERAAQWSQRAAELGMVVNDPDELAARFTLGIGTIINVVRAVAPRTPADVDLALVDALRQHVEVQMSALATRVTRLPRWSDVVLPPQISDSIAELIARVRYRRTVYDTWGFEQVISTSRGLTALFQGGPGTGKTLVASALAHELGLDLYRIDLSRVVSKWIGETEKHLAEVFDAAEEGHALLLFDEADALFARRTDVHTAVDRYANLEVNYLLQRLDSFEGVAVLTTNLETSIDPAFKRRLTCQLTFPFPDEQARERLWQIHLPAQVPRAGTLDLAGLARRYQMSGGYIRNAAVRAAFLAAQDHAPLSQLHLERAIRAEFRGAGKPVESGVLE